MLFDSWNIAILLGQLIMVILSITACSTCIPIIRRWDASRHDDLQVALERSSILSAVLLNTLIMMSIAAASLFMFSLNNHLPLVVKGAMCGQGVLNISSFGYQSLFAQIALLVLGGAFISMNGLDRSQPSSPLTPAKFYLTVPIAGLSIWAFVTTGWMLYEITPDLITTCCSVSLSLDSSKNSFSGHNLPDWLLITLLVGAASLLIWSIVRMRYAAAVAAFAYVYIFYYTLRGYFTRYIYGLVGHDCVLDLFLGHYYYIGFLIFASLFMLLVSCMAIGLKYSYRDSLLSDQVVGNRPLIYAFVSMAVSLVIPLVYWIGWMGRL